MEEVDPDTRVLGQISALKLGRPPGWCNQKAVVAKQRARQAVSVVRALGRSLDNAATLNVLGLPEVALAGYSNSGKSSLLNALTGLPAQRGPASVDSRAGWTESVFAFEAVVRGVSLALVDTPGYGVAVQSQWTRARWERALHAYVQNSEQLRCVLLLVDCTRGLCEHDWRLMRTARRRGVVCQIVLTKADLLTAPLLARSHAVVTADLHERHGGEIGARAPAVAMVSANFVQGVRQLWSLARHHALTCHPARAHADRRLAPGDADEREEHGDDDGGDAAAGGGAPADAPRGSIHDRNY